MKVKNNNGWLILSQEHFIGYVTNTLNNTFTNNFETNGAPYRRLLFPLLCAEKGRLRNAVANRVPSSRWAPKIFGTCCDRLTHSAHCLT